VSARAVFVSYSQSDRETAFAIVARAEACGLACWIAPRDVAPAADWAEEIIDAIAAARVMVLVFSASANASAQVRREVERAVHRGVTVLPFRVAPVTPAKSLEYFLSTQHWLDAFPPPLEPHYARLCERLRALVDTGVASSAAHASFDAEHLRRLEAELARHIGPVAKLLVKRAAAAAGGIETLIERLGGEIASERERHEFVQTARQLLRAAG